MAKRYPVGFGNDHPFGRLAGRLPSLFEDFDRDWLPLWGEMRPEPGKLTPAIDLKEEKDRLVVKADLPGLKEDEIEVICTGDRLTLKAQRQQDKEEKAADYHLTERRFGTYQRTVVLPFVIQDADEVRARYRQGVLTVEIPKTEAVRQQERPVKIQFDH
ncbi:Hsp20/alpha crystallin family protein [Ferrimonas balearica]|uniref:Hsp20/alpha crystallin family protein n=1 Tax=Ferrimonas balearica TaxID=44012 RepID=UPI001C993D54|nr:Hsp20/alpha crystallin family protein [Ferrimonas balearica]MBY5992972.1 Hsp20/alpha crystallin family protein [Ferrimonas balearica]